MRLAAGSGTPEARIGAFRLPIDRQTSSCGSIGLLTHLKIAVAAVTCRLSFCLTLLPHSALDVRAHVAAAPGCLPTRCSAVDPLVNMVGITLCNGWTQGARAQSRRSGAPRAWPFPPSLTRRSGYSVADALVFTAFEARRPRLGAGWRAAGG